MPVVTVVAAALESREAELAGLVALNQAVADVLGLDAVDVFSVHVAAGVAALGPEAVPPWPVVVLHGGDRGRAASSAAGRAAAVAVAATWRCPPEQVWVQWVIRAVTMMSGVD